MDIHEYEARERARLERNLAYMEAGVNFIDIKMAYIDEGVRIGKGTPYTRAPSSREMWRSVRTAS